MNIQALDYKEDFKECKKCSIHCFSRNELQTKVYKLYKENGALKKEKEKWLEEQRRFIIKLGDDSEEKTSLKIKLNKVEESSRCLALQLKDVLSSKTKEIENLENNSQKAGSQPIEETHKKVKLLEAELKRVSEENNMLEKDLESKTQTIRRFAEGHAKLVKHIDIKSVGKLVKSFYSVKKNMNVCEVEHMSVLRTLQDVKEECKNCRASSLDDKTKYENKIKGYENEQLSDKFLLQQQLVLINTLREELKNLKEACCTKKDKACSQEDHDLCKDKREEMLPPTPDSCSTSHDTITSEDDTQQSNFSDNQIQTLPDLFEITPKPEHQEKVLKGMIKHKNPLKKIVCNLGKNLVNFTKLTQETVTNSSEVPGTQKCGRTKKVSLEFDSLDTDVVCKEVPSQNRLDKDNYIFNITVDEQNKGESSEALPFQQSIYKEPLPRNSDGLPQEKMLVDLKDMPGSTVQSPLSSVQRVLTNNINMDGKKNECISDVSTKSEKSLELSENTLALIESAVSVNESSHLLITDDAETIIGSEGWSPLHDLETDEFEPSLNKLTKYPAIISPLRQGAVMESRNSDDDYLSVHKNKNCTEPFSIDNKRCNNFYSHGENTKQPKSIFSPVLRSSVFSKTVFVSEEQSNMLAGGRDSHEISQEEDQRCEREISTIHKCDMPTKKINDFVTADKNSFQIKFDKLSHKGYEQWNSAVDSGPGIQKLTELVHSNKEEDKNIKNVVDDIKPLEIDTKEKYIFTKDEKNSISYLINDSSKTIMSLENSVFIKDERNCDQKKQYIPKTEPEISYTLEKKEINKEISSKGKMEVPETPSKPTLNNKIQISSLSPNSSIDKKINVDERHTKKIPRELKALHTSRTFFTSPQLELSDVTSPSSARSPTGIGCYDLRLSPKVPKNLQYCPTSPVKKNSGCKKSIKETSEKISLKENTCINKKSLDCLPSNNSCNKQTSPRSPTSMKHYSMRTELPQRKYNSSSRCSRVKKSSSNTEKPNVLPSSINHTPVAFKKSSVLPNNARNHNDILSEIKAQSFKDDTDPLEIKLKLTPQERINRLKAQESLKKPCSIKIDEVCYKNNGSNFVTQNMKNVPTVIQNVSSQFGKHSSNDNENIDTCSSQKIPLRTSSLIKEAGNQSQFPSDIHCPISQPGKLITTNDLLKIGDGTDTLATTVAKLNISVSSRPKIDDVFLRGNHFQQPFECLLKTPTNNIDVTPVSKTETTLNQDTLFTGFEFTRKKFISYSDCSFMRKRTYVNDGTSNENVPKKKQLSKDFLKLSNSHQRSNINLQRIFCLKKSNVMKQTKYLRKKCSYHRSDVNLQRIFSLRQLNLTKQTKYLREKCSENNKTGVYKDSSILDLSERKEKLLVRPIRFGKSCSTSKNELVLANTSLHQNSIETIDASFSTELVSMNNKLNTLIPSLSHGSNKKDPYTVEQTPSNSSNKKEPLTLLQTPSHGNNKKEPHTLGQTPSNSNNKKEPLTLLQTPSHGNNKKEPNTLEQTPSNSNNKKEPLTLLRTPSHGNNKKEFHTKLPSPSLDNNKSEEEADCLIIDIDDNLMDLSESDNSSSYIGGETFCSPKLTEEMCSEKINLVSNQKKRKLTLGPEVSNNKNFYIGESKNKKLKISDPSISLHVIPHLQPLPEAMCKYEENLLKTNTDFSNPENRVLPFLVESDKYPEDQDVTMSKGLFLPNFYTEHNNCTKDNLQSFSQEKDFPSEEKTLNKNLDSICVFKLKTLDEFILKGEKTKVTENVLRTVIKKHSEDLACFKERNILEGRVKDIKDSESPPESALELIKPLLEENLKSVNDIVTIVEKLEKYEIRVVVKSLMKLLYNLTQSNSPNDKNSWLFYWNVPQIQNKKSPFLHPKMQSVHLLLMFLIDRLTCEKSEEEKEEFVKEELSFIEQTFIRPPPNFGFTLPVFWLNWGFLYTLLARQFANVARVRQFIYDMLYCYAKRSLTVVFAVLKTWPNVLHTAPNGSLSNDPLTLAIILELTTISFTRNLPNYMSNYNMFQDLSDLLWHKYKYRADTVNRDQLFDLCFQRLEQYGVHEALVLMAKRQGGGWFKQRPMQQLMYEVETWWKEREERSDIRAVAAINIICSTMRAYNKTEILTDMTKVFQLFQAILSDKNTPSWMQEVIVFNICRLSRHNLNQSADLVVRWRPSEISQTLLDHILVNIISRRNPSWWYSNQVGRFYMGYRSSSPSDH